jgi:predicted transcriptional regulator
MGDANERVRAVRGHQRQSWADLPVAELEVLACLWQRGEATARDVRQAMASYRPMTHGAMVTLLKRLEQKALVTKTKGSAGKAFIYRAVHPPQPTYRSLMRRLRQRVFGGSGASMVASLFDSDLPDLEELQALEQLVKQLRAKAGRRRGPPKEEGPP